MLQSYERKQVKQLKEKVILNEILAEQIFDRVAILADKDNAEHVRRLWDFLPEVFKNEKENNLVAQKAAQLEIYKQRFNEYARTHNKKMEGDDD